MNGDKESNYFRVWNGLLEPKHRERMGSAVWLFLYFIDHTTKERPNKHEPDRVEGWVYGKTPITLNRISRESGIPERTVSRYMVTLEAHDYIRTITAPHGLIILVQNSNKWGTAQNCGPPKVANHGTPEMANQSAKSGEPPAKSGERRKDNTSRQYRDNTIRGENTAHSAVSLSLPNPNSESQSQPQEKSNPVLTGKTQSPRPYTDALLSDGLKDLCVVPKPKRKAFTEAEIQEQQRIIRERYPEQFAKAGRAVSA